MAQGSADRRGSTLPHTRRVMRLKARTAGSCPFQREKMKKSMRFAMKNPQGVTGQQNYFLNLCKWNGKFRVGQVTASWLIDIYTRNLPFTISQASIQKPHCRG
jgi:hypothetical protein